jgi:hypothetical protein
MKKSIKELGANFLGGAAGSVLEFVIFCFVIMAQIVLPTDWHFIPNNFLDRLYKSGDFVAVLVSWWIFCSVGFWIGRRFERANSK